MARAVSAWPAPGLGATYEDFPRPGFAPGEADRRSLDLSQEIPFPGKTVLARRTGQADARKAEAEARRVVEEQVFMARQAWWDLVVASESARVVERAREAMTQVVELSGRRSQFGQVGRMEQLMDPMARMESASLKAKALDLRLERRTAETQLNALMGLDPAGGLGEPEASVPSESLTLEDASWLDTGLDDSPTVAVALRDLTAMKARRDQARAEWLPDFMLQYSAVGLKDGSRSGMAMAKVTVPFVWFWGPAGSSRAANQEVVASSEMLRQARLEVRRMAAEEISRLGVVREQLAIFDGEIIPQTGRALDLAVTGYQSGSIGPADVLTAVGSYVSMNIERLMLKAQLGRSVAVLARLKGEPTGGKP
jgi:outer membrane protein TolC